LSTIIDIWRLLMCEPLNVPKMALCALLAMGLMTGANTAQAEDGLGLYAGAGIGQASVKVDRIPDGGSINFDEHDFGWKLMLGARPISPLGAEIEYIDFGHPSGTNGFASADAKARGVALFALGYLPIPLPYVDIFGKLGAARIKTIGTASLAGVFCATVLPCATHFDRTDSRFAWGLGAQVKLPTLPIAVRLEYEHFQIPNGAPNLLTVGALWKF
jgi:opacity protein-like surface antigen